MRACGLDTPRSCAALSDGYSHSGMMMSPANKIAKRRQNIRTQNQAARQVMAVALLPDMISAAVLTSRGQNLSGTACLIAVHQHALCERYATASTSLRESTFRAAAVAGRCRLNSVWQDAGCGPD